MQIFIFTDWSGKKILSECLFWNMLFLEHLLKLLIQKEQGDRSAFLYTACYLHKPVDLNNLLHAQA